MIHAVANCLRKRETLSMRRLGLSVVLSAGLLGPLLVAAAEIQPHMAGWERIFTITWEAGQRNNRAVVQGRIENVSPYPIRDVRVLVDAVDGGGSVTSQRVAYVPGEFLGLGSASFFEVPMPTAAAYRVRVYTYERIESGGDRR